MNKINTSNKTANILLLVIDCQNAFINEFTKSYADKISNLVNSKVYKYVAFTKYINTENSIFYKGLKYEKCLNEEDRKIIIDTKNYDVFEKTTYTALNDELKQYIKENEIEEIHLCGFDTEACVLKTALDFFENNYNVKVLEDYTMSNSGLEYHNCALNILRKLIGKDKVIQ